MRRSFVALVLGLTLGTGSLSPVFAEGETAAQRMALAADYIEATLQDLDMKQMISTMWKPIVADIRSKGIPLNDAQIAEIDKIYQDEMTEPMYKIMRDQAAVMADVFTFEEIKALRDFYATDLGRAAMTKLPELAEKQTPMILQIVQEKMSVVIPQIQKVLTAGTEGGDAAQQ